MAMEAGDGAGHMHFDRLDAESGTGGDLWITIAVDTVREEYLARPGFETHQRSVDPSKNVTCFKSGDLIMPFKGHIAFGYMPIGRLPRPDPGLIADKIFASFQEIGLGRVNRVELASVQARDAAIGLLDDVLGILTPPSATHEPEQSFPMFAIEHAEQRLLAVLVPVFVR